MIEHVLALDYQLFKIVNSYCSNGFFDVVMPFIRNKFFWAPLYGFIVAYLVYNKGNQAFKIILFAVFTIALSDQLSSSVIKPLLQRERPCNDISFVIQYGLRLLVGCGSGYSFPSSHAANHFAFALFFLQLFKDKRLYALGIFWASLVCFAQVYVGVHYPVDIFAGSVLGIFIGIIMGKWCNAFLSK